MEETICALSTPHGVGGIAVVRLSGRDSVSIVQRALHDVALPPRKAVFAPFYTDEGLLDELVATRFVAPHSYTGEDMVELSCHGSLYVQQALLEYLVSHGARLAEPGEFTKRAFLHGRMNLSQAEAVADLIASGNSVAHRLAISQLRGGYAAELTRLRDRFVELTALLELELDFSDEDVEFADRTSLRTLLGEVRQTVSRLCGSFRWGNALKQGVPVAIVGRPNVGKSTLLNALLGEDRAIVSDEAGTTRDTVEDTMCIDGVPFRFIDTAGLRGGAGAIEQAGIQRAQRAAEQARIVLYLFDAQLSSTQAEADFEALMHGVDVSSASVLFVASKADLYPARPTTRPNELLLSAKTGYGLSELRQRLVAEAQTDTLSQDVMLTNVRHYEALRRVDESLKQVSAGLEASVPSDLVLIDLREALYHLGTITGHVTSDEILGTIFGRFCVGK